MANSYQYDLFLSDCGWVGGVFSVSGLYATTFPMEGREQCLQALGNHINGATIAPGGFTAFRSQILSCLAGKGFTEDFEIDLANTSDFFAKVWKVCGIIPIGETRSYSWVAEQIDSPRSFRAVGQAMTKNRLPLIIPCHRVIGKNGDLVGYAGGRLLKSRLLDAEKRYMGTIHK